MRNPAKPCAVLSMLALAVWIGQQPAEARRQSEGGAHYKVVQPGVDYPVYLRPGDCAGDYSDCGSTNVCGRQIFVGMYVWENKVVPAYNRGDRTVLVKEANGNRQQVCQLR